MKNLMIVMALLLSVKSMAALTEQQETYAMFCGTKADLKEFASAKGQVLTNKDILEVNESRAPILKVLKTGNKGVQELIKEGSANSTGIFGVLITCGMITQLKKEITTEGCYDLKTNKAVKDNGGIKACSDLMAKMPH